MIRRITTLVVAALLMMALSLPAAFAASPSERECVEGGGKFDRQQGQVSCETVTVEEGKNPKFTEETTTTTTGQGNAGNKPTKDTTSDCEGTGSDKCPPGQFPG